MANFQAAPSFSSDEFAHYRQLLELHQHHLLQFDRLLKSIELLKEENKILKKKLQESVYKNKTRLIYRP